MKGQDRGFLGRVRLLKDRGDDFLMSAMDSIKNADTDMFDAKRGAFEERDHCRRICETSGRERILLRRSSTVRSAWRLSQVRARFKVKFPDFNRAS